MMHKTWISGLLFALALPAAIAQTTSPAWDAWLTNNTSAVSDNNASDVYADLAAFGAAIKDKRIVMLDEQSHGEENVFALKARLVRYLHEKHGYHVLALESGLYDVDRIWRTADAANNIRSQAAGNVFYLYANSPAMQGLFDYLQTQKQGKSPLILSGMDGQHTGLYARQYLVADLKNQVNDKLGNDAFWDKFTELSLQLFSMNRSLPDEKTQAQYFQFIQKLKTALSSREQYFWQRIVISMEDQALRYWGHRHEHRSAVMGENLLTLLTQRYADQKVIVWGNFVHLNRSGLPQHGNLGHVISRQFKDKVYVVHFTGNKGSYYNFFNDQNTPVLSFPSKTIENHLAPQPGPYNFTDWRKLPVQLKQDVSMQAALTSYLPQGLYELPEAGPQWHERIDATFYLDKITSTKP
ncbi:erythromycin esterase family protein [Undibacterium sp. Di27W]|uniref:erythromycin esterase family protein n=1 Tax=Undibacterium sp. Di27W TaxID=3413036 RepID=UPI003BEFFCB7